MIMHKNPTHIPSRSFYTISFILRFSLVIIFALQFSQAYVGRWHSYTNFNSVTCLQEYNGMLFAGSLGGIRKINPQTGAETDYNNLDGLVDVHIVSLTVTPDHQLWAGSFDGLLYRFEGDRFIAFGKSYRSTGWKLNKRAMVSGGHYIAVGSVKGLSFFDTRTHVAEAALEKFAKIGADSVKSLLKKGDTLFVGLSKGVFKAAVDWDNIQSNKYGSIIDPAIWIPVDFVDSTDKARYKKVTVTQKLSTVSPLFKISHLTLLAADSTQKDSAKDSLPKVKIDTIPFTGFNFLRLVENKIEAYDDGMILSEPYFVKAINRKPFIANDKQYVDVKFFSSAIFIGEDLFLGSDWGIWKYAKQDFAAEYHPNSNYPNSLIANIAANENTAVGMSGSGSNVNFAYTLKNNNWDPILNSIFGPSVEVLMNQMKEVKLADNGDVYFGTWGYGLFQIRDGKSKIWTPKNSCMVSVIPSNDSFGVVYSISKIRKGNLWTAQMHGVGTLQFDVNHLDIETGKLSCFENMGSSKAVHSVQMLTDTILAIAGNGGLDLYKYEVQNHRPQLSPSVHVQVEGASDEAWDVRADRFGRVWVLVNDQLAYTDSLALPNPKTSLKLKYLLSAKGDAFKGHACTVMDEDTHQNFWMGCDNGLYFIEPALQPELSRIESYNMDNGLLDNLIFDLAVSKKNGQVWVTTKNGVNMFEGPARPLAPNLQQVQVYPNPFRAKHQLVVFDNLAKGSSIRIFTQSGNTVRYFPASQILGNQFQWDGNNANGERVKPGVYLYGIEANTGTTQGKLIVARD